MSESYVEPGTVDNTGVGNRFFSENKDCRVCLGQHDEEIHQATLNVRQWFRGEVTKSFQIQPLI